jgi:biopolymer transport protein ExbB
MLFLQTNVPAADTTQAAAKVVNESVFEMLMKGGWVMIPIAILLMLAIFIFIERYLAIKKLGKIDNGFLMGVMQNVTSGNISAVKTLCASNPNMLIAHIIDKGVLRLGSSIQEIESGMESTARASISILEKNLSILAAVATLAPMFGFLGTVMGMIRIFGDVSAADNLSIGVISGGIYEKMITSAAGLVVGVFAHILYVSINSMIERTIIRLENASTQFVDLLYKPSAA